MKSVKLKDKAFIINLHIYSNKVFVVIGDLKNLSKLLLKYKHPPSKGNLKDILYELGSDDYHGKCLNLTSSHVIIHIKKEANIYDVIPHEVLHAVKYIMSGIGMGDMCDKNDEAYCYLNGYINKEIFKKL